MYAYSCVSQVEKKPIHVGFGPFWSTPTETVYFSDSYELDIELPYQNLDISKTYLISGGVQDKSMTKNSYADGNIYSNVSYSVYYEYAGQRYYSNYDNFVVKGNQVNHITIGVEISGSVSPRLNVDTNSYVRNYQMPVFNANYSFYVFELTDDEASKYNSFSGVINGIDKGNNLQEKNNQLQKEQNETSKGILGKITDFFGSFFENLKGLFVPEDGYFSDFFTRLNDFFSEKLGMLYAPIDMFITFLNTIKDASSTDSGITFPELAWDGTVIIPETKFSFNTITKDFPDLQEKIYFVTDVILVGAVLWLLQVKLKEVLEN